MKKKAWLFGILGAIALGILVLCISIFVNDIKIHKLYPDQVVAIEVWPHCKLNAEDTEAFIKLYNKSKYKGEGTGEGGTPEYGAAVCFADGTFLLINEFGSPERDFEVFFREADGKKKDWYYVNNQDLREFLLEKVSDSDK